jgi:predicted PolB exonuclease-like 3'-5' exonuclease
MLKSVQQRVWAFDLEWVPDPLAGRLIYDLGDSVADPEEIMHHMWREGGATAEDPTPYLKTVQCRVVSVAAVERLQRPGGEVVLRLMSLPRDPDDPVQTSESHIVDTYLAALGKHKPQLVGYNSLDADLKILIQRGLILGVRAAGFCARPDKPWQGVDYFARSSEYHIDMREIVGGWGRSVPSLHELAVQSGIPGKMGVDGNQVAQLWLAGELQEIIAYNECDALTTYLVWLRLAHFAGHFSDRQYAAEQQLALDFVTREAEKGTRGHLQKYLEEWQRLQSITENERE